MKRTRTIKLFLKDHIWYIVTCIGAFGLLSVLFTYLDKDRDFLYFGLICLVICIIGLIYRFIRCSTLYEKLASEKTVPEDFMPDNEGGMLVQRYEQTIQECQNLFSSEIEKEKDKNRQHQLMISKWIHQMKEPLSVMKATADKHPYDEDFEVVGKEVQRQNYYLEQMTNIFRLEYIGREFVVEKCSLYEIVREAVNDQKAYFLEKSIFPKVEIEGETDIITDRRWCTFALEQIINNAIKYSAPEGSVIISAGQKEGIECLTIRDAGCGIDEAHIGRIFDLFYTGSNGGEQQETTGMGLYMAKTILDSLNTTISVESKEGEGTTFVIGFEEKPSEQSS